MKTYNEGLTYETYNFGETGGVTKCHLHGVYNNANAVIVKLIEKHSKFFKPICIDDENVIITYCGNEAVVPNHYVGKATVNTVAGDTYNDEIGKQLSHARCMSKYHKQFDKKIKKFYMDVLSLLVSVRYYCEKNNIDLDDCPNEDDLRAKMFSYVKAEN